MSRKGVDNKAPLSGSSEDWWRLLVESDVADVSESLEVRRGSLLVLLLLSRDRLDEPLLLLLFPTSEDKDRTEADMLSSRLRILLVVTGDSEDRRSLLER
jgi:hypothetical protein